MKGFIWKIGMVVTAIAVIVPSGLAYGESDQSKANDFLLAQTSADNNCSNDKTETKHKYWNPIVLAQNNNNLAPPPLPNCISKQEIDKYAQSKGFPKANYPYFSQPDGCGSSTGSPIQYHSVPDGPVPLLPVTKVSKVSLLTNLKIYTSKIFKPACNQHDICYMSVGSKESCDSQMYANTKNVCANANYSFPSYPARLDCRATAKVFYEALENLPASKTAYSRSQQNQINYVSLVKKYIDDNECSNCRVSERRSQVICDDKKVNKKRKTTKVDVDVFGPVKNAPGPLRDVLEQIRKGKTK
jgi:hypothetical protein